MKKRFFLIFLLIFSITTLSSAVAFATTDGFDLDGWYEDSLGNHYYYNNGRAEIGFTTIDGFDYYFDDNGVMQTGVVVFGKVAYFFSEDTGKRQTGTKIIESYSGTYCIKNGILQTGWVAINERAYYFYSSGENAFKAAEDTKIGYLLIPPRGYLGKAYYLAIKKLNRTNWTLRQAYKNSYKLKYANRWMRRSSSESYAVYGFTYNKGNCYCMAATFFIQAKLLGYNVRQIEGKVNQIWPHSWTQIKHNNKWYVYDPNFRNETGRNGWKIYYGKKGTWKYMKYHVFQD